MSLGVAVRTQWGLFGEWWCVDVTASEEDIAAEGRGQRRAWQRAVYGVVKA